MNPFPEIHKRLAAPNVSLWGDAARAPIRVKIDKPTPAQITAAENLAAEFAVDFWTGENDAVIEPLDCEECEFHEI